ncbi:MAG: hypothetical protein AB7O73_15210 [Bacteroidia bacterium]
MYRLKKKILLFALFPLCISFSFGQSDSSSNNQFKKNTYYVLTMHDRSIKKGQVEEEFEIKILFVDFKTNKAEIIYKSEIKKYEEVTKNELYAKLDEIDDYYSDNYLLTPNAIPFKKGGWSSTYHYGVFGNFGYGINENWGITANSIAILPVSIGVKSSHKIGNDTYFGGNVLAMALPMESGYNLALFGGGGKITKGNSKVNFTAGAYVFGYRITDSLRLTQTTSIYSSVYCLTFSYSNRFSKYFALNIDNISFPQFTAGLQQIGLNITGASLRWVRDPSEHWNFGVYGVYLGDLVQLRNGLKGRVIPLPYISYSSYFD